MRPRPPGTRPLNISVPKPGDVRSLRFFAQRRKRGQLTKCEVLRLFCICWCLAMRQMHDLFIFSRPARLGVADPPASSGTYEGILKITSEGDKKPDIIRFNIGNLEATERFVRMYCEQSKREGRIMLHDKDPHKSKPPVHICCPLFCSCTLFMDRIPIVGGTYQLFISVPSFSNNFIGTEARSCLF